MTKVFFFFTLGLFHLVASIQAQSTLSLEIKSSKPETAQIYYDFGSGFLEANSVKVKLKGNGNFERIEFAIPPGNLTALRFDSLEKSGSVELRSVNLHFGYQQSPIPLEQITPANQIAKTEIREGVIYVVTPQGAIDPQLALPVDPSATSSPALAEGVLDEIQIASSSLKACGWVGAGDSANPVTGISIFVNGVEIYSGGFTKQPRPDVAQAKGRSEWLESGFLIQTTINAPLPEGPRKFTATALLKNGDRFDLHVPKESLTVGPAMPATPAEKLPQLLGQLDESVLEGNQLKIRGWVASVDPAQQIQNLLLKSGEETLYQGEFQIEERPDVATALGKPDLLNSGWIVRLDWSGKPVPSFIAPHFEMQTGEILSLPLPIAAQAPSAHTAQPAPLEALMNTRLAWLAAFLLAGGVGLVVSRVYQRRGNSSVPHDLAPPPLCIADWSTLFIITGVFFSIFASKLFLIKNFGSSIPFWDQWDAEAAQLFIPYFQGQLSLRDFFTSHNEHRIALTRLFVLVLFLVNGQWNPIVSMVAQAALHAGVLTLLVGMLRQVLPNRAWVLFGLIATLLYLVPFSWENTLWGFQSQFYFMLLCGTLGIWLTWRYSEFSGNWWIGWVFLLLGLFGMGNGILAPAAAFGVWLVRTLFDSTRRGHNLLALLPILVLIVFGESLLVEVTHHERFKAHNISEFLSFFFKLSGWPTEIPTTGLLLHLPILAIGIFVLVRRPPRQDPAWFLAALGAWSTLAMAALAYGRANHPLASRYTDGLAFGLMISLASALYLSALAGTDRIQRVVRIGIAFGVAIVAGGLFHSLTRDLMVDIPAHNALEPIQKNHLLGFLSSGDTSVLENKPHLHVPYPNAQRLAQILNNKDLQQFLPASIRMGIAPVKSLFSESSFVPNGGTYPTTPGNPKPHFGSYSKSGDSTTGELRMYFATPPTSYGLILPIAGYPRGTGMSISLETQSAKVIPVRIQDNPKEAWQEIVIKNPGEPFAIVAVDGSPKTWLAIGFPAPVGQLSLWVGWILNHWYLFGAIGIGFFMLRITCWFQPIFDSNNKI